MDRHTHKELVSEVGLHIAVLGVEEVANGYGHVKQLRLKQSHEPIVLRLGDWAVHEDIRVHCWGRRAGIDRQCTHPAAMAAIHMVVLCRLIVRERASWSGLPRT